MPGDSRALHDNKNPPLGAVIPSLGRCGGRIGGRDLREKVTARPPGGAGCPLQRPLSLALYHNAVADS
ncbi:hypothetical protein SAMN05421803_12211 [Nocardiopsis flavescens]|uniref:Uncharacterized protein n=1 Tax=Nocardiopsis flavescens TaxID=758803 RepID=A0A1M6T2B3_9ACTN|nr:hypothetical protein SAMN05421803_12211 [Nocardiopsis flavescens]